MPPVVGGARSTPTSRYGHVGVDVASNNNNLAAKGFGKLTCSARPSSHSELLYIRGKSHERGHLETQHTLRRHVLCTFPSTVVLSGKAPPPHPPNQIDEPMAKVHTVQHVVKLKHIPTTSGGEGSERQPHSPRLFPRAVTPSSTCSALEEAFLEAALPIQ